MKISRLYKIHNEEQLLILGFIDCNLKLFAMVRLIKNAIKTNKKEVISMNQINLP